MTLPRCLSGLGCLAAGLIAAVAPASAYDLGREWRSLWERESEIVFLAPGLKETRGRFFSSVSEDETYTLHIAYWTGRSEPRSKAVVYYYWSNNGYGLGIGLDPQEHIETFGEFSEGGVTYETLETHEGPLGTYQTRKFRHGGFVCLGFTASWPLGGLSKIRSGSDHVLGYYCPNEGEAERDGFARSVVQTLGVRRRALPDG